MIVQNDYTRIDVRFQKFLFPRNEFLMYDILMNMSKNILTTQVIVQLHATLINTTLIQN